MSNNFVREGNLSDDAIFDNVAEKIHFESVITGTGSPVTPPSPTAKRWLYVDRSLTPAILWLWDPSAATWVQVAEGAIDVDLSIQLSIGWEGPALQVTYLESQRWPCTVDGAITKVRITAVENIAPGDDTVVTIRVNGGDQQSFTLPSAMLSQVWTLSPTIAVSTGDLVSFELDGTVGGHVNGLVSATIVPS